VRRRMLNAKIHRATVTAADLNYVGSVSIDPVLLHAAGILEYEQVGVLNVMTGARFETYAIVGGPGEICLNGAAARLAQVGDLVILVTYADLADEELKGHRPTIVHVDGNNRIVTP
jgi:aspartate 1-decarboxylase